jgi:hypothetical protein
MAAASVISVVPPAGRCQPSGVTETSAALCIAAARNNADWCAAVCRSHDTPSVFGDRIWRSTRRPPPYYPDAVTLHPAAVPADVLPEIDTASPGCSIKDSFAALDLTPDGFAELFTARWIHRPAGPPTGAAPALRIARVATAAQLHAWQAAWHGGDTPPDVFRPALLADPSVLVLAFHHGDDLRGGAVLNRGRGPAGLSNVFAVDADDLPAVWSSAVAAAARHFPGSPLVGYEHADALAHAAAEGFTTIGSLRVWVRA